MPARRQLPPIQMLQAFEVTARHLSVTRAAEELSLTQSAVSRQIAGLEALLDLRLFQRQRQRLALTPAGAAYAPVVRVTLGRLHAATEELLAHRGAGGTLNLAVSPTFGTRWLMPRMPRFAARHRQVVVNIRNFTTRLTPLDFAAEEVDAGIWLSTGLGEDPGVIRHKLVTEERLPVCAPALAATLREPADLARCTLLQLSMRPRAWTEWLEAMGVHGVDGRRGPQHQHMPLLAEAAAAGLGVALLPRFMLEAELAQGRLVAPFGQGFTGADHYVLGYPEGNEAKPALRAFRDWLLGEGG